MVGCVVARRRSQVSGALPAIALFTSLLLLATILNREAFDFDLSPVWVWTLSYTIYPAIAVLLIWRSRRTADAQSDATTLPSWARTFLQAQGIVFALVGLTLLIAPSAMVDAWPWPISAGLAQFYGGPFLAYAVCSWLLRRQAGLGRSGGDRAGDARLHERDDRRVASAQRAVLEHRARQLGLVRWLRRGRARAARHECPRAAGREQRPLGASPQNPHRPRTVR